MVPALAMVLAVGATQGGAQQATEVSLEVVDGRLVVPVTAADGRELRFALTGNPPTILAESVAAALGEDPALTVGGLPVHTEGTAIIPDRELAIGSGARLDGMVGTYTLSRYDVLVDAPGGRLVLKPVGPTVDWQDVTLSEPVRLRVFHGVVLSLDVVLEGTPYMASIDLGMSELVVNRPVIEKSDLEGRDTATLTIGTVEHPGLPVALGDLPVFERWDPDGEGFVYIGAPLAVDCAVSISWVHRELRTCVR